MDRERLTITLQKSILKKVDNLIDRTKIRNRSHAIEYLLTQSLTPNVTYAVILAGGKGLKMRPFTFEMPKGLFPVGGKPILEHIVEMLRKFEVRNIIFSLGHLGGKIKDHFGDGKKFGVNITYIFEKKPCGTAGALLLAQKYINTETFFVMHGDILIDINLSDLVLFHKEEEKVATLALTTVVDPSNFGDVILHGSNVTRFIEKPQKGKQLSQLVSSGLYVFNKSIFSYIEDKEVSHLEDIFPRLATNNNLAGFIFAGRWFDIGTPKSYEQAIREWSARK